MANETSPAVHSRTIFDWDANHSDVLRLENLIGEMAGADHKDLVADVNKLADTFEIQFSSALGVKREQARAVLECLMDGFNSAACATDWRLGYGKTRDDATIPEVAVAVIREAAGLLGNAFSSAGVRSYINRHNRFIKALARFAVVANGDNAGNRSFYEELGRRVAIAVLEHEPPKPVPLLAPITRFYDEIANTALAQMVYFIQCGAAGPVKIGIAKDPQARLANLQTGHHDTLHIRAIVGGGVEQERAYHAQFSEYSLRGEWFSPHPDILAEIERLTP